MSVLSLYPSAYYGSDAVPAALKYIMSFNHDSSLMRYWDEYIPVLQMKRLRYKEMR